MRNCLRLWEALVRYHNKAAVFAEQLQFSYVEQGYKIDCAGRNTGGTILLRISFCHDRSVKFKPCYFTCELLVAGI